MKIVIAKSKNSIVNRQMNVGGQDPCCGARR